MVCNYSIKHQPVIVSSNIYMYANEGTNKHSKTYLEDLIPTLAGIKYVKQKHLGCKKGEANQKQQLSDYTCN